MPALFVVAAAPRSRNCSFGLDLLVSRHCSARAAFTSDVRRIATLPQLYGCLPPIGWPPRARMSRQARGGGSIRAVGVRISLKGYLHVPLWHASAPSVGLTEAGLWPLHSLLQVGGMQSAPSAGRIELEVATLSSRHSAFGDKWWRQCDGILKRRMVGSGNTSSVHLTCFRRTPCTLR